MPADIAASHALSNAEDVEASLSQRIGAGVLLQVRTELSPTHRTAILLAVMHVPTMWHNTTMHVQHWLEVYRRARAPKPKAPPQVNTVVMTVFSGCTGSGTPIIALMWALQNCMKQWPTWAIVIDRFLSYEIRQNCNASAELCYSMLHCPVEQRVRDTVCYNACSYAILLACSACLLHMLYACLYCLLLHCTCLY
jgi:hypothetical protein